MDPYLLTDYCVLNISWEYIYDVTIVIKKVHVKNTKYKSTVFYYYIGIFYFLIEILLSFISFIFPCIYFSSRYHVSNLPL
jgi:hypothetical protein